MADPQREQWASHTGFVLATIGSAVGLGNIWRFAYVAGENGGGTFLVLYALGVLFVGAPLVLAELTMGRRAQADAITAFDRILPGTTWRYAGLLFLAGTCLILGYYAVIAGWALKYFVGAALGSLWRDAAAGFGLFFESFIAHPAEPVAWQFAMLAATVMVSLGGIRGGIEVVNRVLMPVLGLLLIGLAVYAVSQPGSAAGVRFLLAPDWSALTRPDVYLAALGQAFFSLGVGMAIFITYGGYMRRGPRLPVSVGAIIAGDTLFAITAGLAIFPIVFAHGVDPAAGPKLAFITLPQVFLDLPGGAWAGVVFFGLLAAAALTSMVSILEVPTAFLVARAGLRRAPAVIAVACTSFAIGVPAALSYGVLGDTTIAAQPILDAMDTLASGYLLPVGGLVIAVFVGWRWGGRSVIEEADFGSTVLGAVWLWLLRVIVPAVILLILVRAIVEA
jgi:NSS family neurotransmitter:Na+ symporter